LNKAVLGIQVWHYKSGLLLDPCPTQKAPRPAPYVLNQTSQPSPTQGFLFQFFLYKKFEKKNPTKKLEKEVEFTL
jgi:hypothetical protein